MSGYHKHPKPIAPVVYGRRLSVGEIIQEGDLYPSPFTGRWEKTLFLIGKRVQVEGYWVRPEI